ncbi:hypothetical protein L1987_48334 [Smallanthus sonchifolius]|uniref:Uncharacterized protein n=1 Tax=Smallanthus sonchifolius TaxID=185202 RepID=A0ACB9FST0_9ASTR|nr:hypothetical protein L1987_48334 [Smallanthus sonchifolius]
MVHESLGGKPKRKRKNKKQLDAQQQVGLVDIGAEAKDHEAKGEVPQGINITVNSVEDPTICERKQRMRMMVEKHKVKKSRRKRQPTQEVAATEESDLLSAKE